MKRLSMYWIGCIFLISAANCLQAALDDDGDPDDLFEINQRIEEAKRRTKTTNFHCPSTQECMNPCPLGYVEDDKGCPICDQCVEEGTFESDIIIDKNSYPDFTDLYGTNCNKREQRGSQNSERKLWPKNRKKLVVIGYVFDKTLSKEKRERIEEAIEIYKKRTCIRFIKRRRSQADYLNFVGTGGCSSHLGRIGGKQKITIGDGCAVRIGTILHELMHALGFWHEHSRGDRDDHIQIFWENIYPDFSTNFLKQTKNWDPLGSPYDTGSVMHYGSYTFSKPGRPRQPTILDINNKTIKGQRKGFSKEDVKQINRKYKCTGYPGYNGKEGYGTATTPKTAVGGQVTVQKTTTTETTTTKQTTTTTTENTTTPSTKNCKDRNKNCKYWADKNFCREKHVKYMQRNCRKTCGLCSTEGTTATPVEPKCNDEQRFKSACPRWAKDKFCDDKVFRKFMERSCKKSCKLCLEADEPPPTQDESSCNDRSDHCGFWAGRSYCNGGVHVKYMKKYCRKACGVCKDVSATATAAITTRATTTKATTAKAATPKATVSTKKPTVEAQGNYERCGITTTNQQDRYLQRIVGGKEVTRGDVPWIVNIRRGTNNFCGGSLVSHRHVITAAHCFYKFGKFNSKVLYLRGELGKHNLNKFEAGEETVRFSSITIHPDYVDKTSDYDVAVLTLSRPVRFTANIRPVCLPRQGQRVPVETQGYVSGWGDTQDYLKPRHKLQQVEVRVINRRTCSIWLSDEVTENMFCAGYKVGGKDACQGDSGGPFTYTRSGNQHFLGGIVSWGYGCALRNRPGVYTQVAQVVNWIRNVMRN